MGSLDLLHRYLSRVRVRREVAEIAGDDAAWVEACEAESDALKAISMVQSGEWFESRGLSGSEQCPPPVPRSWADRGI